MAWKIVCPAPGCGKRFKNVHGLGLQRLKQHMATAHEGYSAEDIASATEGMGSTETIQPEPPNSEGRLFETSPEPGEPPLGQPVRRTRRDRDLNDKLNNCIDMAVERLLKGSLSSEREEEFSRNRADIRNAMMGFEFNFEERLLKVSSKWVLLLVLVVLYISPYAPNIKVLLAEMKGEPKREPEPQPKPEASAN